MATTSFRRDGVEIAYLDEGAGEPIILVHGFASNKEVNWVQPGWLDTLTRAGRRAIALDNRGHGQSSKLYDPEQYHMHVLAGDVRALLDHLHIHRADIMGYSMGGRITAFMGLLHPERVRSAVLGGIGYVMVESGGMSSTIADALEAPSPDSVSDPTARSFRIFAERTNSNRRALAACMRGSRQMISEAELARLRAPVLIAVGTEDQIAGSPHKLAALIPGARVVSIPGRDHMLAVGDRVYKEAVLKFLEGRP